MFEISDTESYILVKALGNNSLKDFIETIHEEIARPEYPYRNDIWVFGEEIIDLRFEQLETITEFIVSNYPTEAARTKTALVTPAGLNAAIVALWLNTASDLPFEAKIFSTQSKAKEWLAA